MASGTAAPKTLTRSLPVALTDNEQRQAGINLAQVVQDIRAEESSQVEQKQSMKARLGELESRREKIAIMVSRKEEYRDVEVQLYPDYQRGIVEEFRADTGEKLGQRRMTDEERQQKLLDADE